MFAAASTAISAFQMVFFCKNQQTLSIEVIIFRCQGRHGLLFVFHGVAQGHFLYLYAVSSLNYPQI